MGQEKFNQQNRQRSWRYQAVGVLFLFSGAALLMHILSGVSLRLGLAAIFSVSIVSFGVVWWRLTPAVRSQLLVRTKVGVVAGLIAIAVYDVTKWGLSIWDPSPFNPFGAIRTFGVLLATSASSDLVIVGSGVAFHVLNGLMFAVTFSFLFGHRGVIAGMLWGLFLETFQSMLYPGWLDIRFYQEFLQITVLAHVFYGAVLGYVCKRELYRKSSINMINEKGKK